MLTGRIGAVVAALAGLALAELELNPGHFGGFVDFGQAMRSSNNSDINDNQPLNRSGVFLVSSGTYDRKFEAQIAIGGLFWFALPEQNPSQTRVLFGPGVGEARGTYKFGNSDHPAAILQMGLFGHKYNTDAKNLGEYLFRSGTYPVNLWSGGWSYLNAAAYLAQGFRFTVPTLGGKVTHDLTLYMERDIVPAHDFSPAYLLTLKPASFLEIGTGVVWANGLSFKPDSILTPTDRKNAYDPATGLPLLQDQWSKKGLSLSDPRVQPDTATCLADTSVACPNGTTNDGTYISTTDNGIPNDVLGHYSFQGWKGMLRFGLNFGTMFGSPAMPPDAFKLYGEVALLGFKNYPFYYEKRSERMPVMLGMNLPTFGLLDMLSFEMEYLKSPFKNTISASYFERLPIPLDESMDPTLYRRDLWRDSLLPDPGDPGFAMAAAAYDSVSQTLEKEAKRDDWKWSVYLKRKLPGGLTLTGQVASDHLRHFGIVFAKPSREPATMRPSEWYYVLRVEFGI